MVQRPAYHNQVTFIWIPGLVGFWENESVDSVARLGVLSVQKLIHLFTFLCLTFSSSLKPVSSPSEIKYLKIYPKTNMEILNLPPNVGIPRTSILQGRNGTHLMTRHRSFTSYLHP